MIITSCDRDFLQLHLEWNRPSISRHVVARLAAGLMAALLVAGALALPTAAHAGLVYGTVFKGSSPQPNVTFEVATQPALKVKTDGSGRYRIFLKPGLYVATYSSVSLRM